KKLQSFKNIRVDDFFCNFLDKRFCFFFLKLEQIFIFQRSPNRQVIVHTSISETTQVGRSNPFLITFSWIASSAYASSQ
ncbi:MAG: hypothetical protein LBH67_03015, partial [Rickettsia sp.]|nr:hypothetical protein [Rickettsia sp.]